MNNSLDKLFKLTGMGMGEMFNLCNEIILVLDEKANVVFINKNGFKILGYNKESEIIGKNWISNFIEEQDQKSISEVHKKLMNGKQMTEYENSVKKKNGDILFVSWYNSKIKKGKKIIATVSSGKDVTDLVKQRKKLQESELRFRLAAHNSSDLIYEWNLRTDKLEWFGDIDKLIGYSKNRFPRTLKAWFSRIQSDDAEMMQKELDKIQSGEISQINSEYRIKNKKGKWLIWIDKGTVIKNEEGSPIKLVGVISDITERKEFERTMKERTEELEKINKIMIGREIKMIELKEKIRQLSR